MAISLLPSLSRSDPAFKSDVDTFFGTQLPNFTSELNTEIDRINQLGFGSYSATSTTTNTIGVGTKTFTIETGKSFVAGQVVIISDSANVSNYMVGQVSSYVSNTGVLTLTVSSVGGSGTSSSWSIGITGLSASPYINTYNSRFFTTSTTSWVVPDGVKKIRAYVVGKGGNTPNISSTLTASGSAITVYASASGGGGGGHAYGDITVTPGDTISLDISTGIAKLIYGGVELLVANPGGNGNATTTGVAPAPSVGGTATKHASVLNGGAFTGAAGTKSTGGGCILPTGTSITSGSALSVTARSLTQFFNDPFLEGANGPSGSKVYNPTTGTAIIVPPSRGGGGGSMGRSGDGISVVAEDGADFGGGGNASVSGFSSTAVGGKGGFMAPGGRASSDALNFSGNAASYSDPGAGGVGSGSGGADVSAQTTGSYTATAAIGAGLGGSAAILILY